MIYFAMFVCAVVTIGCFAAYFDEDCPRVIMGYNCHGDRCDHSDEAVEQAKIDMGVYYGENDM